MGEKRGIYVGNRESGAGKPVNSLHSGLCGGGMKLKKKKDDGTEEWIDCESHCIVFDDEV